MIVRIIFTTAVLVIAVLSAQTAWADAYGSGWYGEGHLSISFEDNISRSYKPEDLVSDTSSRISVGGGYSEKVGVKGQFVVSGYMTWNRQEKYDALNHLAMSLGARYVYQPSIGFNHPWYEFSANVTRFNYKASKEREGVLFDSTFSVNKRLTTRVSASLGYRYLDFVFLGKTADIVKARAAFDTAGQEVFAGVNFRFDNNVYLVAEYGYRHGGFTATVSGSPGPWPYEAESEDHVFDSCNASGCLIRYAYRTVADVQRLDLALLFTLAGINFDLSGLYLDAEPELGPGYTDWLLQFGAGWNF